MLPDEYQDAAKMAGLFTIVFRLYGPLLRPPIVALVTLTFLGVWNDYLWPSLTISGHLQWSTYCCNATWCRASWPRG